MIFSAKIGEDVHKIRNIMSGKRKKNIDVISAITKRYPSYLATDFIVDTFQESSPEDINKYVMQKYQLASRLRTLISEMEVNKGNTDLDLMLLHEIKSLAELYEKELAHKYTIYDKEN